MNSAWKICMGLTLIGLAIVGIDVYTASSTSEKVKTVASWPTVPGYVVESTIMWNVPASPSSSRTQSHSYHYELKVRTDYMIDGHYFSNTTPGINEIRDQKYFYRDPWKNLPDEDMIRLFKQVPRGRWSPFTTIRKTRPNRTFSPNFPSAIFIAFLFSSFSAGQCFSCSH